MLAVLFAVVALLILPRRMYRMRSVTLDDGPWPPDRHHTPTPAEVDTRATATPPAPAEATPPAESPGAMSLPERAEPGTSTAPRPETEQGAVEEGLPERRLAELRTAEHTQLRLVKPPQLPPPPAPSASVGPHAPAAPPPEWPPFAGKAAVRAPLGPPAATGPTGEQGRAEGTDGPVPPRPALPVDGDVPYVRADVHTEVGPTLVRLAGVTTGPTTPAYAWLADDESAPAAAVPLVLGRKGPWRLQVDLGRAPDVFTLVGTMAECRRLAAAYARQLHADGIEVTVVGDALGAESVAGSRSLARLPEPDDGDEPYVVITAAGAGIRELAADSRCVPMVIGPVANSRWSVQLDVES
ncbi:hypothetical protein D3H59_00195 [Micromonospora endophytica]|nr:hypothetical protein D3H59_00195 [Micromonospora endophytica]